MNTIFYKGSPENINMGMTLKDADEFDNNMALHTTNNPNKVISNRKQLAEKIHCSLNDFVCTEQTHSANFHKVTTDDKGRGAVTMKTAIRDTDALYTDEPNIVLCSFTADCVPVVFYDNVKGIVGVIHSGWQGTVKEITTKVFDHLTRQEQCNPENIHVHLGPALSQEKFEVDEDVFTKYKQLGYADNFIYYNKKTTKYHIDNQKIVKTQCELSGIPSHQIIADSTCTFLSEKHFSYRQDKQTGRHLSFILRKT